jgi:hypothetical protein
MSTRQFVTFDLRSSSHRRIGHEVQWLVSFGRGSVPCRTQGSWPSPASWGLARLRLGHPGGSKHDETFAFALVRRPYQGHRPRSMPRLRTGSGLYSHAHRAEARHTLRSRVMRHFRGKAHRQGLSPLESSLPPGGGLSRPGTRCSPGFSMLFRVFPALALGRCLHRPSSHRLSAAARPPKGASGLRTCSGSLSGLPLRVSMSKNAGRSLARPTCPLEVPDLVVQPGNSKGWLSLAHGFALEPEVHRCPLPTPLRDSRCATSHGCPCHPRPFCRSLPG